MSEFSKLREQAGLSIAEAATLLGYKKRKVYRWENGDCIPKPPVFYRQS